MGGKKSAIPVLLILCVFIATIIIGCSSGDSGGDWGNIDPIPTSGTISQANAQKVAYNAFRMTKVDPSSAYNPEIDNKKELLEIAANHINDEIDSGRLSGQINKIITDPYDGEGTVILSGTYDYDATTKDWNATLSMVYSDIHISIPQYSPSDFNASGTLNVTINFNRTASSMSSTLAYAGYHIDNGVNQYDYTGSIAQNGILENREIASYTANSAVTMSATTTEGTGSLVFTVSTSVTVNTDTGEGNITVTGTMTYSDFDGAGGVATISTTEPITVNTSGTFTDGTMTVTDISGNILSIEITGSNQVTITLNGNTVFSGNLEDFYVPIDVPPYF